MYRLLFALTLAAVLTFAQDAPLAKIYDKTITQADIKPGDKERSLTGLVTREFALGYVREHKLEPTEADMEPLRRKFAQTGGEAASKGPQADWFIKLLVTNGKLQRVLYRKHGGRVALSAFGAHTAIDATIAELKLLERNGQLRFFDAAGRQQVFSDIANTRGDGVASGKNATEAIESMP